MQILSLDQMLEEALTGIYRAWYRLPRRSTLPQLQQLRTQLAQRLLALTRPVDLAAYEQAMIAFAKAALALPGVSEVGDKSLAALAAAQPVGPDGKRPGASLLLRMSDASAERIQALAALLQAGDPPQYLIVRMTYASEQAPRTWNAVVAAITPRLSEMPAPDQAQIRAIRDQVADAVAAAKTPRARLDAYLDGLRALEQVPAVIRVAAAVFFANKYVGPAPTYYGVESLNMGSIIGIDKDLLIESPPVAAQAEPVPPPPPPPPPPTAAQPPPAPQPPTAAQPPTAPQPPVLPTVPAAPSEPPTQRVDLFADVRFPAQVQRSAVQWLSVQLTVAAAAESRTSEPVPVRFAAPTADEPSPPPEYVEVRLLAPGFTELTGVLERTMLVYADRDSQPAVFLLSSDKLGPQRITLGFYHKGRMVKNIAFTSEVVAAATVGTSPSIATEETPEPVELPSSPPPPADLELRVARTAQSNGLAFMLNSALPDVPFRSQPAGETTLTAKDPQTFFANYLQRLSDLAANLDNNTDDERMAHEVASLGEGLFEELLPPRLQDIYWTQIKPLADAGKIKTLLINSDEPWIPWELVKPYRWNDASNTEERDDFLVEQFTFSRWLARPLPPGLAVNDAALVMPELDLTFVEEEKHFFDDLAGQRHIRLLGPLQQRNDVLDRLRQGQFQLLHFATHGSFNPDNADLSQIALGDGSLTPADLMGGDLAGLRTAKPLVFLNACHSGQVTFSLTGLGGWADKMFREARASAFVGTLWAVNDELAVEFARTFYTELVGGKTLGEALRSARTAVRERQPGNPTWLAYSLYGDPNAKVTLGG